ncbi:MAG: hypothetical protein M1816_001302 [Peltula sp. TS41687]|nr:MAG: hypothetical protein M1816_001302 [Peltula sp. TS41687]
MLATSTAHFLTIQTDTITSIAFRWLYGNGSGSHHHPTSHRSYYHQDLQIRIPLVPIEKKPRASIAIAHSSTAPHHPPSTKSKPSVKPPPPPSPPPTPPTSTRTTPDHPPPVLRPRTVDAATQYSPPQRPMEKTISTTISVDPALVEVGKEPEKRRAGSSSSQLSSSGEPRAPALGPRMPHGKRSDDDDGGEDKNNRTPEEKRADRKSSPTTSTRSGGQLGTGTISPKRLRPARPAVKVMPARYELCDTKNLVALIADMLMELVRFNDDIPLRDGRLTRFHSRAPPGISILDYLQRLTTHATLSPPILLSMVYYIDRLCALYPAFIISSLTVHRFLIASATVASKGLSDSFWTNATYARVGGISLRELALLELEFLVRVQWRIVPKPEVLVDYYRSLIERSEGYVLERSTSPMSLSSKVKNDAAGAGTPSPAGSRASRSSSKATSRKSS